MLAEWNIVVYRKEQANPVLESMSIDILSSTGFACPLVRDTVQFEIGWARCPRHRKSMGNKFITPYKEALRMIFEDGEKN